MALTTFFIFLIVFLITTLPLYFAVNMLGGKTGIIKTFLVVLVSGILMTVIREFFTTWGWIIAFIFLIWFYHELFRLKWWKALVAWLLQFVFLFMILAIIALITGITAVLF